MRGLPDPRHMENFAAYAPLATHHEPATCEQVNCARQRDGFVIPIDLDDDIGDVRAGTIRKSARRFAEFICRDGDVTVVDWGAVGVAEVNTNTLGVFAAHRVFAFPPGEDCFKEHTKLRDRDPIFEHARGFRHFLAGVFKNPRDKIIDRRDGIRRIDGDELKERMNESADAINRSRERG